IKLENKPVDIPALSQIMPQAGCKVITTLQETCESLVSGNVIVLLRGYKAALSLPLTMFKQRVVTEPENEKVARGPRDGFLESIWVNIGMLRSALINTDLRFETLNPGTRNNTLIGILYIEGLANEKIVEEVRIRLKRTNVDRLLATGYIQDFITDSPWSPFPTSQITERPDQLVSALLNGRVGIMLDGTPIVGIVPVTFWEFFKAPDDYIEAPIPATLIRLLRLAAVFITLILPGLYVALTTFHIQMIPESIAIIIAGSRIRTPLPTALEILIAELLVEVLREASLRMPKVLGQTISIIGALVIGDAATTTGIIGPFTVIVVAFTTLASFVIPSYNAALSIRILRFPLILMSAAMGFFGLTLGAVFYLTHMVSLRSFGVPYMAPVAPWFFKDMRDLFVRLPWWLQVHRPTVYRPQDEIRVGQEQKPKPD
ncbi:MAG TPA: spore germination protein, partial [Candidatus Deferrimicrobium sp.]|nr:spore germination protein [Candidatus Deferrimicrobium sp.]